MTPTSMHDMQRLIGVIAAGWVLTPTTASAPSRPRHDPLRPPTLSPTCWRASCRRLRAAFTAARLAAGARLAAFIQRSMPAPTGCRPRSTRCRGGRSWPSAITPGRKPPGTPCGQRDPLDVAALRAAADARIALGERAAALPLLNDALTLTSDRAQRLPLLRIYASC